MLKRLFDIFVATILLIILSWVLVIIYILVLCFLGRPVIFRQLRPGQHGKIFIIYKFRTMRDIYDAGDQLLPCSKRLTNFGRFLREYSLDELPELFNVLKGEMSLVGPRPLLVEYLQLYSKEQARRCELKPGITGWAQINGRNAILWREKFKLDLWYINNRSLWLDIKILCMTLKKVLRKVDIDFSEHVTAEKFNGYN
jgi:sugar transferase EpsL